MAKSKSSASSATRKKHANKKASATHGEDGEQAGDSSSNIKAQQPAQRGQKKAKKDRFAPKIKSYTPPPPPPKGAPDPVDLYHLAVGGSGIDPELVVILRKLAKKDEATVGKGVEGLESWVKSVMTLDGGQKAFDFELEAKCTEVVRSMDVWAHHFTRLALHPSRKLRLQTLSLHRLLTSSSRPLLRDTRSALLSPQWIENPEYIGSLCVSSWDSDRAVRSVGKKVWDGLLLPKGAPGEEGIDLDEHVDSISGFAVNLLDLDRAEKTSPTTSMKGKWKSTEERKEEEDAIALERAQEKDVLSSHRTQALLTLSYLVDFRTTDAIIDVIRRDELWQLLAVVDHGQAVEAPSVRRALYDFLGTVVVKVPLLGLDEGRDDEEEDSDEEEEEKNVSSVVGTIAQELLRNCWAEEEGWAGIVAFLRKYPQAWTLSDQALLREAPSPDSETPSSAPPSSPTLSLFLNHLSTSCSSHPSLYETVILLLATIPPSMLPATLSSLDPIFTSFWSALESRSLNLGQSSQKAKEEWTKAFLECLAMQVVRVANRKNEEDAKELATRWMGKVWELMLGVGETRKEGYGTANNLEEMKTALERLAPKEAVFNSVCESMTASSLNLFNFPMPDSLRSAFFAILSSALHIFSNTPIPSLSAWSRVLATETLNAAAIEVAQSTVEQGSPTFLAYVQSIRDMVDSDAEVRERLDALATQSLKPLLAASDSATSKIGIDFLISHLASPTTSLDTRNAIWTSTFAPLLAHDMTSTTSRPISNEIVLSFQKALESGTLPADLPNLGLEKVVVATLERAMVAGGRADGYDVELVERVMLHPAPFVSEATVSVLVNKLVTFLNQQTTAALLTSTATPTLDLLVPTLPLLAKFTREPTNAVALLETGGASGVFEAAYLLESCRPETSPSAIVAARTVWKALKAVGGESLVAGLKDALVEMVRDVKSHASPSDLISAAAELTSASQSTSISNLLPSQDTFYSHRTSLSISPPSPALSIFDSLIPQSADEGSSPPAEYDSEGLSSYARTVLAALEVAGRDHSWLRRSLWILPHIQLLGFVTKDELALAGSTSGLVAPDIDAVLLKEIVSSTDGLSSYTLSSFANLLPDGWHSKAVTQLRSKTPLAADHPDQLMAVLDMLCRESQEKGGVYARRMFQTILHATMRYSEGSAADAERWLAFARSLPDGSEFASSIILATKDTLGDSPSFQRYQNELASVISGVPASAASDKGLKLLRVLLATAPPLDAPIIFLPQQRSMFMIQKIQSWIASDEDLDDEIHSAIAEVFLHLAPIVQDLSGSHWELVFDIIESNLEISAWDDFSTYPALYNSCQLISVIKDLAERNAELRSTAKARIDKSLELVRDLFVARPDSGKRNAPQMKILEIMANLVHDLPSKLLVMGPSFDQLIRLLKDPSIAVQQSSYDLVSRIAKKHVEELVVEVELDDEKSQGVQLPLELVDLLAAKLDSEVLSLPEEFGSASTYLMAWLTAFTFFDNASPRIKGAFLDQLRKDDIVALSFLPSVFGILGLTDRPNPFDMVPYNVDEFHIEMVDQIDETNLPILASFVYYRSLQCVPSLIRSWWESCKNRQLSMAVSSFTSRHFSPVLISRELAHLRDPQDPAGKSLRDNEDFTVKVAAGANEVKVVFVVDEQNMEIGIKLPNEFPLYGVEVKDVRKVGVTDAQWRAWLLAVQQVVTAQNGLIADALSLFKRNVTLHFEGVEACAICYSVISVVDRSLPTKACRTCNNRFHAGCLFKWFSTSHGSSCPLCRSLF